MASILEIKELTKRFSDNVAVDGVSFSVNKGVCFGLLGPNGAGKTTTIEMMEGILPPTSGEISYQGRGIDNAYREDVGIQFQHTAIQDFLTVEETLKLFIKFYKKSLPIEQLIETCALESILNRDTRKLSGGQKQRLLLALAILNDPTIVFLDEPTTGLDPQARRNFWQLIDRIKKQNKTVILTTHYMDEAESLCDEIVIMDKGKIIEQGAPQTLLSKHFEGVILSLPKQLVEALTASGITFTENNNRLDVLTEDVEELIRSLLDKKLPLDGMQIRSPDLEDLFIKLTGHMLRG
jgi:ABC-2 type transport system ATP-binding protein